MVQRTSVAAAIFPVRSKARSAGGPAIDIDIQERDADAGVIVNSTPARRQADGSVLDSLILDFGPLDKRDSPARIQALRFGARRNKPTTAQVWLETSNDLKQWGAIGAAGRLTDQ